MEVLPIITLFLGFVSWVLVLMSQSVNKKLRAQPTQELIDKSKRLLYALYVVFAFLVVALAFHVYGLVQAVRAL